METLLVLPIYLMLLGGLFVVGDLLLARIRGGILDRTAAWLRPGATVPAETSIAAHHRFWEGVDAGSFGWTGMKLGDPSDASVSPIQSWGVKAEETSDIGAEAGGVPTQGNTWCGFYQGVSFVSAGVPFWVPLLDIAQSVYAEKGGEPRSPSVYRIHPDHPGWKAGADPQFGRRYVFTRRNAAMADRPLNRCVHILRPNSSEDYLRKDDGGYYQDIILDSWPCVGGLVSVAVLPVEDAYVRSLAAIALAEQKSGVSQ